VLKEFGVTVKGTGAKGKAAILDAVLLDATAFMFLWGAEDGFQRAHGTITINILNEPINPTRGNCGVVGNIITCSQAPSMPTTIHEFGHVFDNHFGGLPSDLLGSQATPDNRGGAWSRSTEGFMCPDFRCLAHPPDMGYWTDADVLTTDQTSAYARDEQLADLYMNFILQGTGDPNHGFTNTADGHSRIFEFWQIFYSVSGR
jgi:hypothetical protein